MKIIFNRAAAAALAVCAGIVLLAGGCERAGSAEAGTSDAQGGNGDDATLRIVSTIRPLELFLRELLGPLEDDRIKIVSIMAPEVSPHGFEPTPRQIATLSRADVVILNGLGLDDWAARSAGSRSILLRFADVVDEHDHHHHHEHDHHDCDHDHGPVDEHLWLDIPKVREFAAHSIAHLLPLLEEHLDDPAMLSRLREAHQSFDEAAAALDGAFREGLSPHAGQPIITHHNVFSRIAGRYGLGEPIVLRPMSVLEPSAGDIRRAIETIRQDQVRAIFIEPQFSASSAERIRDQTGVRLIEVDPLGGQAEDWSGLMRSILEALKAGLAAGADD